mgnify:CR=1 FL=1
MSKLLHLRGSPFLESHAFGSSLLGELLHLRGVRARKLGHLRREADLPELPVARLLGAELPAHLRQRESPELQLSLDRIDQVGQAHMVVGREEPEVVQVAGLVAGPVQKGHRLLDRHLVQGESVGSEAEGGDEYPGRGLLDAARSHVRSPADRLRNSWLSVSRGRELVAIRESHSIRREAVHRKVTYYTTIAAAKATCVALDHLDATDVNRLQDLHLEISQLPRKCR